MRCFVVCLAALMFYGGLVLPLADGIEAYGNAVLVEATAFQDEGTTNIDVFDGVSALDEVWSPKDVVPVGTVSYDHYATGTADSVLDAISLEFNPTGLGPEHLRLRAYLQKGSYSKNFWQYYQLLPGKFNPHNQDVPEPPEGIVHPGGILPSNTVVGWVEFPFDATSDSGYLLPNGNVGATLRLWNWRVDAVQLVGTPPGDADLDGKVNDMDAAILATYWQYVGPMKIGWEHGDFNDDGKVTDADAAILATHWQEGVEDGAPIPEPSTPIALLSMAVVGLLIYARRRRC